MRTAVGLLACTVLSMSAAGTAGAATFKPAGKYVFTSLESCEAKFTFTFGAYKTGSGATTNAVKTINSVANGHIGSGVGYITFTPTTASGGTFTVSLTDISGGALRINTGGVNVTTQPQTASGSYSFSLPAATFTLSPAGESVMTFTMAYGTLSTVAPVGAPSSVHLIRQSSSGETGDPNNCVQSITATK